MTVDHMIVYHQPSSVSFFVSSKLCTGNFKDKKMWRVVLTVALAALATSEPLRFQPQDGAIGVPGTIVCPDRMGTCPTGSTCCRLASGRYGCCSFPEATCCSDHLHCCPHGYTCDVAAGTCNMGDHIIAMETKHPAYTLNALPHDESNSIVCPGGMAYCPDDCTCCRMTSGSWGCCPIPQAVCCSDGTHCCPNGYNCDTKKGTCMKGAIQNAWSTVSLAKYVAAKAPGNPTAGKTNPKISASSPQKIDPSVTRKEQPLNKKRNVCPGAKTYCDAGRTCCYQNNSNFGCCSYVNGTCCADMKHCCPLGYTCDIKLGKCTKGGGLMLPLGGTHESKSNEPEPEDQSLPLGPVGYIVCPDGVSECADTATCCMLPSGDWGCCPLPQAVCCTDNLHCCPKGTTCDLSVGSCDKDADVPLTMVQAQPNSRSDPKLVMCGDDVSTCADTFTCCQVLSGEFMCCPLPEAVCCSDDLHCCPSNTECDVTEGFCKGNPSSGQSQPWATKIPSTPVDSVQSELTVTCFDEISTCPDGYTCCQIPSGVFMCCPMTDAICCLDHIHCCPDHTMCNEKNQTCDPFVIPWTQKVAASPMVVRNTADSEPAPTVSVTCGDNKTACQEGTTCCKMLDGYYSCCPFPDAVCCEDKLHCCPKGETCDIKQGRCKSGIMTTPWAEKLPATPAPPTNVVCPGGASSCPSGSTCCDTGTGSYGCCPLPQAVCCSDHTHCCPNGYTCDLSTGTCSAAGDILPLFTKTAAQTIPQQGQLNTVTKTVICPDKQSYCPDKTTCCQLPSKQYGCCPLPDATCCPDKTHCCPSGYKCDPKHGSCLKASDSVPWAEKTLARPVDSLMVGSVVCPDKKTQCQDQYTCCLLKSGTYGCCPMPQAVCCKDGLHCCPSGMHCDTTTAMCLSSANSLQVSWSNIRRTLSFVQEVDAPVSQTETCGDKKTECPQGSTCCQMKSGRYGCCPYTKATCCSDQVHCCPKGFVCDSTGTRCEKKHSSLTLTSTMFTHFQATPTVRDEGDSIVCPGGKVSCQTSQTCCQSKSGTYGCCPFPSAVCCSDGTHCCPQGYACDLQSGTCTQSVPWVSKIPAVARQPAQATDGSVICPDQTQQCPSGSTCCRLVSGDYGCCPMPEATCCSDGQHCCPHGYQCTTAGMCTATTGTSNNWQQASLISIATNTNSDGKN